MSAVRGLTPYILLDPEDDEEGTKSVIAQALKPKLKAPLPSGSPLKRGEKKPNLGEKKATDPGISKAHVKPRFQPSVPAKPHRVDTAAETPRKDSKGSDANEASYDQDAISTGREHQRLPPSLSKRKDRPTRSQSATGQIETRQTRHVTSLRKDSQKKEFAGKSTWGHPIESQKEDGEEDAYQETAEDGAASAPKPRRLHRPSRAPPGAKPPGRKQGPRHEDDGHGPTGASEQDGGPPKNVNNGKQAAEKSSQAPNSVESKPVQLTLQEYMASEEASDSKSGETVKKSKGLYVASDDSDWAGIVISVPKSAEKDQQQKDTRKKNMSNKVRSQNILLSLDDKQTEASGSESYGSFRSSRSRGPAAGQREPRKPHGENNGIQEHGGRRYPSGPRPPPRAAPTRNGQSAQEKQPVAAAPPAEESKIDPKEKFSLDFPALS